MIPINVEELNTDWLRGVLDVAIDDASLLTSDSGTTGRAVLGIEAPRESGLPSRLFVKLPPTDEMQRLFVTSNGMGRREALFYNQLAGELPVRVPRSYYANTDASGERYIMLLEHLEDSGCTFNNGSTRYSLDYVREMLAAFASFHAAYWASPRFDTDLAWLEPPVKHDIAVELIGQALKEHRDEMPAVFTAMGELYMQRSHDIHALWQRGEPTVIHGDAHDANLFYDQYQPGFLDWALVAKAPAMRDVGYFLAGTLIDEHRHLGRDLLTYYREQLLAKGAPAPAFDELWQQYQWHAAYVWVGATTTLAMGDAWQPVNYVKASLKKLHGALVELDSVAAIERAL